MWVKICGTTNAEDALLAAEAGADAVGFVFAESARKVTVEQAAEMTALLPSHLEKVGVFTRQDADEIFEAAMQAGLTAVQLHSPFAPSLVQALKTRSDGRLRIFQVVALEAGDGEASYQRLASAIKAIPAEGLVDAVLLDTVVEGDSGGTGVAFDWERAAGLLAAQCAEGAEYKLIVAGGLRPQNVGEAIRKLQPWGVDVVSGVEASKGKKSADRVKAFVAAARLKP